MESMHLLWEPGNGTRYEILITKAATSIFGASQGGFVVVGPFSDKLRAMVVSPEGGLHYTYVMEKMGLNEIDASCVTVMLREALRIEAWPMESEWFTSRIKRPFVSPTTLA